MQVLICGGRDITWTPEDHAWMQRLHAALCFTAIWHGAASGVDTEAEHFGQQHQIPTHPYPADWEKDGSRAGPIRNTRLLREFQRATKSQERAVIAFPGGKGTADMLRKAQTAALRILRPYEEVSMPIMTATDREKTTAPALDPVSGTTPDPSPLDDILDPVVPPETLQDAPESTQAPSTAPESSPTPASPYGATEAMLHGFCEALQGRLSKWLHETQSSMDHTNERVLVFLKEWIEKVSQGNEHAAYQFSDALLKLQGQGLNTQPPYAAQIHAVAPQGFPVVISIAKQAPFTPEGAPDVGLMQALPALLAWLQEQGYAAGRA